METQVNHAKRAAIRLSQELTKKNAEIDRLKQAARN
jgi:hypothetical protein